MDFSKFDARKRAEEGVFVELCDPWTGEPMGKGKDRPGFLIRGFASRSVQARQAEMERKTEDDAATASADSDEAAIERIDRQQVDEAMGYVIEARNIEIDGQPVGNDPEMMRRVLGMVPSHWTTVTDEHGMPVMTTITDDKGKQREVPKVQVANKTYAAQVVKAAMDGQRFFGKT